MCKIVIIKVLCCVYLFLVLITGFSKNYDFQNFSYNINTQDIKSHIQFLASKELEGRLTGTKGEKLAVQYVADFFKFLKLSSFLNFLSYFHEFEFNLGVNVSSKSFLNIYDSSSQIIYNVELAKDWLPLGFSNNDQFIEDEVVFAGYGIVAPTSENYSAYNSYLGLDVKNKWVMVLRYLPENIPMDYKIYLSKYADLIRKAIVARDLGAKGIIFVNGPNSGINTLVPLNFNNFNINMSLMALSLSDEYAQILLGHLSLKDLQDKLDNGEILLGFKLNHTIQGKILLEHDIKKGTNVIGALMNTDLISNQHVIIGAHIDHLGVKVLENGNQEIYYGADDNASGVSGVLEIAHLLAYKYQTQQLKLKKNILFAIWSGEELGCLGSLNFTKYVKKIIGDDNLYPFISSVFNADMIGRFNGKLFVQGVASSTGWNVYIDLFKDSFNGDLVLQDDPYLPTDSTSFYLSKVPIINFFTGTHEDYHKTTDTWDKINFEGIKEISQLIANILIEVAQSQELLDYVVIPNPSNGGVGGRVYLGTIPDFSVNTKGVALAGVKPQGPADKAGLTKGDIIVQLAGYKIENIYDYQYILGLLKPNVEVDITILRLNKILHLKITPLPKS